MDIIRISETFKNAIFIYNIRMIEIRRKLKNKDKRRTASARLFFWTAPEKSVRKGLLHNALPSAPLPFFPCKKSARKKSANAADRQGSRMSDFVSARKKSTRRQNLDLGGSALRYTSIAERAQCVRIVLSRLRKQHAKTPDKRFA